MKTIAMLELRSRQACQAPWFTKLTDKKQKPVIPDHRL